MTHIQQKIIDLRNSKGFTQSLAAAKIGVPSKRYQSWEEGRARPPVESCIAIADYYKITLDELLRATKNEPLKNLS